MEVANSLYSLNHRTRLGVELTLSAQVKAILVNIFGGIVDCRVIAKGIVTACNKTGSHYLYCAISI